MQNNVLEKLQSSTAELLKEFSVNSRAYNESSLIDSIKEIRGYNPLPYEKVKIDNLTSFLVDVWFSQRMRKKYDEISSELFELKREVEIDPKKLNLKDRRGDPIDFGTFKQEIPVFVYANLEKDLEWKKEFSNDSRYRSFEFTLSSRMPNVPLEVRKPGKEAVAYTYETYADAIRNDILSNVIKENPHYAPHPKDSKLFVLWKPRPSDIHIEVKYIDKDPALVLEYGRHYLVETWKEPDEEPFMHILSVCKLDSFMDNK